MGASRKLQGEIDRVLKKVKEGVDVFDSIWNKVYDTDNANQNEKFEADLKKEIKKLQRYRDQIKTWIQSSEIKDKKVSASYEQALMDAHKLIEREMERFKICEKETKTKAFSKEGLGQQPKTDPKEKAKSETRDWLNNTVSELESQIDSFEAEMEGLSDKKGKAKPPRLTHLESSITRHKAHIMKLELILRLLDNDELSPVQVNDVKEFVYDYVERNQEDFDEIEDVDMLYNTLSLDMVDALEDLVFIVPPGLVKGVGATSAALSMKNVVSSPSVQSPVPTVPDQVEELLSHDNSSDHGPKTPAPKASTILSSSPLPAGSHAATPVAAAAASILTGQSPVRGILDNTVSTVPSSPVSKEEDVGGFPGRKSSPAFNLGRGSLTLTNPSSITTSSNISTNSVAVAPSVSERVSGMVHQSPVSSLSNRMMSQGGAKTSDGGDNGNGGDASGMTPRVFSPSGLQRRPGSPFQNQHDGARGRPEIAPDQREKFLQRFQQVQQQTQSNTLLNMRPTSGGNHKQFSAQQSPLLQKFNSQSSTVLPQGGMHGALSAEIGNAKADEMEQRQSLFEVSAADPAQSAGLYKKAVNEENSEVSYALDMQRYTLKEILSATNNFSHENLITEGPLGKVYSGQLSRYKNLVVQRLNFEYGQGDGLLTEVLTIKSLEHKNVASIFGYCVENNEKIIIYEAFHGTINQHLSDPTLTWSQRLQICFGVARGLNYIHYDVIHCDINSSKIILDEYWEPKIYGFELSTKYPQSWRHRLIFSCYFDTNNLTPKYDVYSFGVLLLEVLCGRKPVITNDGVEEELEEIIDPNLRTQIDTQALALFTNIAYKCLNQQHLQRPTMDQIIKELEEVLELQWEHGDLKEHSVATEEVTSSDILKISLREIRRATNGFSKACFVGSGGYADVYRAKLDLLNIEGLSSMEGKSKDGLPKISRTVAVKRILSRVDEQGKQGFLTELNLLTRCKHPNIVSLLGFCRDGGEMILVYEYAFKGSLADYLLSGDKTTGILSWEERIQICLDIAHGISYLHTDMEGKPRIIHRDIKSDNILLDENMNAKLADFGLSKSHPANQQPSTIYTKNIAGTTLYMDPEYLTTGKYKRESDIYSFGVVLFEVLSGRVAYDSVYTNENEFGLAPIARRRFSEGTLKELIDPKLIDDDDDHIFTLNWGPNQDSFHTFSKIAYQCLAETQSKRPTINVVIKELQNALKVQGGTVVLSRAQLSDIVLATENFAETYCIGLDAIGTVYKAELNHFSNNNTLASEGKNCGGPSKKRINVAIKRITSRKGGHGKQEFFEEIEMRTSYQHPNIVPLLGFCDEGDEMILVYERVSERSLGDYLKSLDKLDIFTWTHRLHMCLEIARGLNYLHIKIGNLQSIIHIDIKSTNILLDKNGGAKIAYFVTSKLHKNKEIGMKVYKDPEYKTAGKLKRKSDIYSFGVVLFEIFCGRLAYDPVYIVENDKGLAPIVRRCYNDGTIGSIMDPKLKVETDEDISTANRGPNQNSLHTFLKIAYECLGEAAKRPTMEMVIKELEMAVNFHDPKLVEYII